MAISSASLLLRRTSAGGTFSTLRRSLSAAANTFPPPSSSLAAAQKRLTLASSSSSSPWNPIHPRLLQSLRGFRLAAAPSPSSAVAVPRGYKFAYEEHKPRELGIEVIEGCDMNHWLIVIDFPRNPRPSREEMVRFYEETCAKALNLSLEEAKKKIYACSTSNYTGFHVEVTEIESEKFHGIPGVVFVLPDSYADPEKKEYGGDKYINGVIIPRPRPNLNGKRTREKKPTEGGQSSNKQMQSSFSQAEPTEGKPISNQPKNPPQYSHQGVMQGTGKNHEAQQSYSSPRNYGFQGQAEIRDQDNYQFRQNYGPSVQGENRHPANYSFQQNYGPTGQGERRDTVSPGGRSPYQGQGETRDQRNYQFQHNYGPPLQGENRHPANYSFEQNYGPTGQGERRDTVSPGGRSPYQGQRETRDQRNYQFQHNYGPPLQGENSHPPNHPFQGNYGPTGQDERRDTMPVISPYQSQGNYQFQHNYGPPVRGENMHPPNYTFQQNYGPTTGHRERRDTIPTSPYQQGNRDLYLHQRNYNQNGAVNFCPQEHWEFPQGYQMNYAPPRFQGDFREDYQAYRPPQGTPYGQGPYGYHQGVDPRSAQQGYHGPIQRQAGYQGPGVPKSYWHERGYREPTLEDQSNFQGPGFHPQEHREFWHGYQWNYAPPGVYQGGFREEYRYYGPTHVEPRGQGPAMGGYQGQRAPEAYWQGPNYEAPGFSQLEPRNTQSTYYYPQGPNECQHGDERGFARPNYETGFRADHQNYSPVQHRPSRQDDNGYRGQGRPKF